MTRARAAVLLVALLAALPRAAGARGGGGDSFSAPSEPSSFGSSSGDSDWLSGFLPDSSDGDADAHRYRRQPPRDRRPHILYPGARRGSDEPAHPLAVLSVFSLLFAAVFFVFALTYAPQAVGEFAARLATAPFWKRREPVVGVSAAPLITRDPAFDRAGLLIHAQRVFGVVQAAWSHGTMDQAAALVSDGVVERFETLLALQRLEGRRNEVSDLSIEGVELVSVSADDRADRVTIHFTARCRDRYFAPDGRVLSDRRDDFEEDWTFLRSSEARGRRNPGPVDEVCPKCGARVEAGRAALCRHCRTWLNSGEHGWVLCEISQPTAWRLASRTAGWAFEGHDDAHPALLEDRAAVFFWWVLKALADGDASGLAGLTEPALLAELGAAAKGPTWFGECGVGEVTLTGSRRDERTSFAEFEVLWSGVLRPRGGGRSGATARNATRLVLSRPADAAGAFAAGLRAAHCAGCGVPAEPGKPVCAYCSRPRGAAAGDWVLAAFSTRPWG